MLRIASKLRQVASQAADSGPSSAREYFCVHGGYRTVASVIVTRPPLVFVETPELREYRQFKAAFEKTKQVEPAIDEHQLVYMRLPTHFLASREDRERKRAVQTEAVLSAPAPQRNKSKKHEHAFASVSRKEEDNVHLVVKYRDQEFWTFPMGNRKSEVSMKSTLERILSGVSDRVHVINYTPSCVRTIEQVNGKLGAKIFYYRAWYTGAGGAEKIKLNSDVAEIGWMTRDEIRNNLSPGAWKAAHEVLPLEESSFRV